jgi:hypothetical protein
MERNDLVGTGVRLMAHAVDIGAPMQDLETQVEKLAERLLPVVATNG